MTLANPFVLFGLAWLALLAAFVWMCWKTADRDKLAFEDRQWQEHHARACVRPHTSAVLETCPQTKRGAR